MSTIESLHACPAPAKLNLYLHVTGRRADGYHEIETVFELIDLADRLDFIRRDDRAIVLRSSLPGVPNDAEISLRAARALADASGTGQGVEIMIHKRIPMGGGLGGGSSDAATTLLALNRLWALNWPCARLAQLALSLGADVPVFVHGTPAYATGVGEHLIPIDPRPLPVRHYLLVVPDTQVPTGEIFADERLTRHTKPIKISGLSRGDGPYRGRNDLEAVACRRYPAVARALEVLVRVARGIDAEHAGLARMSGSGATVFMPLANEQLGRSIQSVIEPQGVGRVLVVRSLDRHPLRDWAFGQVGRARSD